MGSKVVIVRNSRSSFRLSQWGGGCWIRGWAEVVGQMQGGHDEKCRACRMGEGEKDGPIDRVDGWREGVGRGLTLTVEVTDPWVRVDNPRQYITELQSAGLCAAVFVYSDKKLSIAGDRGKEGDRSPAPFGYPV